VLWPGFDSYDDLNSMMTAEWAVDSAGNHAKSMIGERLESVKRLDYDWDLRFDAGSALMFQSVWRLVSDAAIEVTSEDDGQKFGLKTPIDAASIEGNDWRQAHQ
jgi:hypothetical protein